MAVVYLLHWLMPDASSRHYLGAAPNENAIDVERMRHGAGVRQLPVEQAATLQIADVWDMPTIEAANGLRAMLAKQGGRRRLCSVCTPGNSRGGGRGRWLRTKRNGLSNG